MLTLETNDTLFTVISKLRALPETEIALPVSGDFSWTQNRLNLKLLLREARILKKNLTFKPQDKISEDLVSGLQTEENNEEGSTFGFVTGKDIVEHTERSEPTRQVISKSIRIPKLPVLPLLSLNGGKIRWLAGGFGLVLILLSSSYFLLNYVPRATVTLTVSSESLVKGIEVEASTSATIADVKARIIPATIITATAKGKGEGEATGKKDVGDKAQGKVIIYNKTDNSRLIRRGMLLRRITVESGGDLPFLLSFDVSVPARESVTTPQPGFAFGQAESTVSAQQIGTASNLTPNQTFSVGDFSTADFIAQNKEAFSGGATRSVKIITKDDQQKILDALGKDLDEKLKADLRARLVGDQKMEDGAVTVNVTKKSFDRSVGDEADKFNLDLEKQATALAYSPQVLEELLGDILKDLVPANYELYSQDKSVSITGVRVEKGIMKFTAKVKGYIVPRLDLEKIKSDVAGRPINEANTYLTSLPGLDSANLTVFPVLRFWQKVPAVKGHINIIVDRK